MSSDGIFQIGVKGYVVPKHANNDVPGISVQNWKVYKLKERGKKTFLDDVISIAKKNEVKGHTKQLDWNKEQLKQSEHGHFHKHEFLKNKRETLNEEIFRKCKAAKLPAPGAYDLPKQKIQNIPKTSED